MNSSLELGFVGPLFKTLKEYGKRKGFFFTLTVVVWLCLRNSSINHWSSLISSCNRSVKLWNDRQYETHSCAVSLNFCYLVDESVTEFKCLFFNPHFRPFMSSWSRTFPSVSCSWLLLFVFWPRCIDCVWGSFKYIHPQYHRVLVPYPQVCIVYNQDLHKSAKYLKRTFSHFFSNIWIYRYLNWRKCFIAKYPVCCSCTHNKMLFTLQMSYSNVEVGYLFSIKGSIYNC